MKNSYKKEIMISVIIPVHNDAKNLELCLNSVMQSTYPNYECIVITDGSDEETVSVAERFPVKVINLSRQHGPAFARNQAARAALGDILFFTDADVQIYADTLSEIAKVFIAQPGIDAVIGSYDKDPADTSFISQYKNLFHHYVHQNSNSRALTFWSGCGAIRREVFLNAGGFNEKYGRPAVEDIDLGYRLTKNEHQILLQKQIQVKHLKRWTFLKLLKTDIFQRGVPWTKLILKKKIFPNDLNLSVSQRWSVVLLYLFLLSPVVVASVKFSKFYIPIPLIFLFVILVLNRGFYKFYKDQRGVTFALRVVPMHILYFFYCGLSFFIGVYSHTFIKMRRRKLAKAVQSYSPHFSNSINFIPTKQTDDREIST